MFCQDLDKQISLFLMLSPPATHSPLAIRWQEVGHLVNKLHFTMTSRRCCGERELEFVEAVYAKLEEIFCTSVMFFHVKDLDMDHSGACEAKELQLEEEIDASRGNNMLLPLYLEKDMCSIVSVPFNPRDAICLKAVATVSVAYVVFV